jgi:GT2 family glycosyltransferase
MSTERLDQGASPEPASADLAARCSQLEADLRDVRERLRGFIVENEQLRRELVQYENSVTIVLAGRVSKLVEWVLPYRSKRRRAVAKVFRTSWRAWNRMLGRVPRAGSPDEMARREDRNLRLYREWLRERTPTKAALDRQRLVSDTWEHQPVISICTPVHDPLPEHLLAAIASVEAQSYTRWELCMCDDGSTGPEVAGVLERAAAGDGRIKVVTSSECSGISAATNRALQLATGEYVAFLDHDDVLAPHALFSMVERLQGEPHTDLLYSDEDVLLPDGERADPFLKPDWSPETQLCMNVVTHFLVVRRRLVTELGGLRSQYDGAQDHDLVLRVAEVADSIAHVPEVLYSWRQSERSTARSADAKRWAFEAGPAVVRETLSRRGIAARVEDGALPGGWRVRYQLPEPPPEVAIVIPTRDRADLLRTCIDSLLSLTDYPSYSVVVLDNDSRERATRDYLASVPVTVVESSGPFNYSAIMNRGFEATSAGLVVTLNNDTWVTDPDWLRGLVELASRPDVGVVGCRLVFPDGSVQHEGIVVGRGVPAANLVFDMPGIRMANLLHVTRDVSAVTGACSLIQRDAWASVGGFDEGLGVVYNDVDLCLRARHAGYRVLYTPHVTLVHEESSSRGLLHPMEEQRAFLARWGADSGGDPYFPAALRIGIGGWQLTN